MQRLPLAFLHLYARLLLRSQYASATSCDRPSLQRCTVIFLGSVDTADFILKLLHYTSCISCSSANINLKIPTPHLPLSKLCHNATFRLKISKFSPNTQLIPLLHIQIVCFPSFTFQRSILRPAYTYQKDERALHGNFKSSKFSVQFYNERCVSHQVFSSFLIPLIFLLLFLL